MKVERRKFMIQFRSETGLSTDIERLNGCALKAY
jgi:hypothetical protein